MQTALRPGETGNITITRQGQRWVARTRLRAYDNTMRDIRRKHDTKNGARQAVEQAVTLILGATAPYGQLTEYSTLYEATEAFLQHAETHLGYSPNTLRTYRYIQTPLFPYPEAGMQVRDLTPLALCGMLHRVGVERGLGAAKTIRTLIRHAGAHLVLSGILPHNVAREATFDSRAVTQQRAQHEKMRDHRRAFTDREMQHILHAVTHDSTAQRLRLHEMVNALRATGMRIGEACHATYPQLNKQTHFLTVEGTKSVAAKRGIHIPPWWTETLTGTEGQLCPAPLGGVRDKVNCGHRMREFLDEYGYQWAVPHTFRRTVATKLDQAGWTAREIADHLGHARPSMTQDVYMGRYQSPSVVDGLL